MINNKFTMKVVFESERTGDREEIWPLILRDMLRDAEEIGDGWDEVMYLVTKEGEIRRLSSWIPAK
jgi:hypothetical protein